MQLTISFEKYIALRRIARDEYISLPPRFHVYAEDEEHNLFIFKSDGQTVTAKDLLFVHMKSERSRNSYSYAGKFSMQIMARPVTLYGENSNIKSQTAADAKLIKTVIEAVTATPVCFPVDECDGLSQNKLTISYQ